MSVCLSLCGGACVGVEGCSMHQNVCLLTAPSEDDVEKPGKAVPSPVLTPLPAIQLLSVSPFPILWPLVPACHCLSL